MTNPKLRFKQADGTEFPDWTECELGSLAEIKDGARVPNSDWQTDGVPYIRARDFNDCLASVELFLSPEKFKELKQRTGAPEQGDVIFVTGGNMGLAFYKEDDAPIYVQGGAVLTVKTSRAKDLSGKYLYFVFQTDSAQEYIKKAAVGGTIKHFTVAPSSRMPIVLPVMEEQWEIAEFFSVLDGKISLIGNKLAEFEKLKKGVMQKIFRQEVRFRREDGGAFPDWVRVRLDSLLHFQNGINTDKENFGSGIKLISVLEVLAPRPIRYDDIRSSVTVDADVAERFSVTYGDVLFQRSSETAEDAGMANVYVDSEKAAVFGGFVIRGKKSADYDPIFLNEALRSPQVRRQIVRLAQGAQHVNIGQESLSQVVVELPTIEEQRKISALIISFYEKLDHATKRLEQLHQLKKAFMQQMFV